MEITFCDSMGDLVASGVMFSEYRKKYLYEQKYPVKYSVHGLLKYIVSQ